MRNRNRLHTAHCTLKTSTPVPRKLPKLSGFEVCEQIKGDEELKHIMILMVTALDELGDVERAVDAGTNDFLSKPVNRLTLQKRVENMLALKGMADENERLRKYIQQVEDDR